MGFFCSFQKATLCDPGIDTHGLPELFRIQGVVDRFLSRDLERLVGHRVLSNVLSRFGFRGLGLRDIKTRNHCIYDSLNP